MCISCRIVEDLKKVPEVLGIIEVIYIQSSKVFDLLHFSGITRFVFDT